MFFRTCTITYFFRRYIISIFIIFPYFLLFWLANLVSRLFFVLDCSFWCLLLVLYRIWKKTSCTFDWMFIFFRMVHNRLNCSYHFCYFFYCILLLSTAGSGWIWLDLARKSWLELVGAVWICLELALLKRKTIVRSIVHRLNALLLSKCTQYINCLTISSIFSMKHVAPWLYCLLFLLQMFLAGSSWI